MKILFGTPWNFRSVLVDSLNECEIQIVDGFVDLPGVFETNRHAIDSGLLEGESHRCLAIFVTREGSITHKLHADHPHSRFAGLLDVSHNLCDIARPSGVVVLGVHVCAFVVHSDHGHFEPFVSRDLAQRREPVNRGAVTYDGLSRLGFQNSILPAARVDGPGGGVLPVEQHNVEVIGLRQLAQLVEFLQGIRPGRVVTLDIIR